MTWLGHDLVGVHGQRYAVGPDGLVSTDVYGTIPSPAIPDLPVPGSPLSAVMDDLRGLQFSVSFEGEGNHLGLRVRADWARR